jgi:hypothetical protein
MPARGTAYRHAQEAGAGVSLGRIAKRLGRSYSGVYQLVRLWGIKPVRTWGRWHFYDEAEIIGVLAPIFAAAEAERRRGACPHCGRRMPRATGGGMKEETSDA